MAMKDAATVAQHWANQLAGAGQRITDGVNGVTIAPGQAAARQSQVWLQNTQAAQAKFARNVAKVSLSDWQAAVINKGVSRIGAGATAAVPKMTSFLQKFLPAVQAAKAGLPPRGTYDQNKARATAMMDALHKFSNS